MKCDLPERIKRELCEFARKRGIGRVIMFGSRARGSNTERSDIDIAVAGGDYDGFYWDVSEKIHSLLMFDIVNLDTDCGEKLRTEIERDGVVLYEQA